MPLFLTFLTEALGKTNLVAERASDREDSSSRGAMQTTTLVAVLMAYFALAAAQGLDCNKMCRKIDPYSLDFAKNPCDRAAYVRPGTSCHCWDLARNGDSTLHAHRKGTKVAIFPDNIVHLWCHDSHCLNEQYCRLDVRYREGQPAAVLANGGSYLLPEYNDCCTIPKGYVEFATIREFGW